jgi:hypothetical protein
MNIWGDKGGSGRVRSTHEVLSGGAFLLFCSVLFCSFVLFCFVFFFLFPPSLLFFWLSFFTFFFFFLALFSRLPYASSYLPR